MEPLEEIKKKRGREKIYLGPQCSATFLRPAAYVIHFHSQPPSRAYFAWSCWRVQNGGSPQPATHHRNPYEIKWSNSLLLQNISPCPGSCKFLNSFCFLCLINSDSAVPIPCNPPHFLLFLAACPLFPIPRPRFLVPSLLIPIAREQGKSGLSKGRTAPNKKVDYVCCAG